MHGGENFLNSIDPLLEVVIFPAYTTSVIQPADQGAIKVLKDLVFNKASDRLIHADKLASSKTEAERFSIINNIPTAGQSLKQITVYERLKIMHDAKDDMQDTGKPYWNALDRYVQFVTEARLNKRELTEDNYKIHFGTTSKEHIEVLRRIKNAVKTTIVLDNGTRSIGEQFRLKVTSGNTLDLKKQKNEWKIRLCKDIDAGRYLESMDLDHLVTFLSRSNIIKVLSACFGS